MQSLCCCTLARTTIYCHQLCFIIFARRIGQHSECNDDVVGWWVGKYCLQGPTITLVYVYNVPMYTLWLCVFVYVCFCWDTVDGVFSRHLNNWQYSLFGKPQFVFRFAAMHRSEMRNDASVLRYLPAVDVQQYTLADHISLGCAASIERMERSTGAPAAY